MIAIRLSHLLILQRSATDWYTAFHNPLTFHVGGSFDEPTDLGGPASVTGCIFLNIPAPKAQVNCSVAAAMSSGWAQGTRSKEVEFVLQVKLSLDRNWII